MSASKQTLFWIGAMAALLLFVVLLHDILLPFVVGAAFAYFLDPLADPLESLGFSRLWSTNWGLWRLLCRVLALPMPPRRF